MVLARAFVTLYKDTLIKRLLNILKHSSLRSAEKVYELYLIVS